MMWDIKPKDAGKHQWPERTHEGTSPPLDTQKEHSRTSLKSWTFSLQNGEDDGFEFLSNLMQQHKKINTLVCECCNH